MPYTDLREFINRLENENELLRIRCEVDWKYELGGWVRKSYDMKPNGPALLFENIKGYGGQSFFAAGLRTHKRIALALDLPPDTPLRELIKEYMGRCEKPVDPVVVREGPCKENVHVGDEADLLEFPVPHWHPKDGGRFIGTWHGVVSKDPETGWTNVGMYRMMVHDSKRAGVGFLPFAHLGIHYSKAEAANKPLPIAVVIGADETVPMVACTPFAAGVNEYRMAGALRKSPLQLVKCETVDLEVPATSEIVLEGEILPNERLEEGPFGEYTGYHGGPTRLRPIFRVTCITHRNNPIFRGTLPGKPIDEESALNQITNPPIILKMFEDMGTPVKAVNCPPGGAAWLSTVIQMKPLYVGHSRDVAHMFIGSNAARHTKITVIVDEDIDIFDLDQVWWALTTRVQAGRDVEVFKFCRTSRSDPSAPRDAPEITDKMVIDATKKLDYPYIQAWKSTWAPVAYPPEEIMNLVELKWESCVNAKEPTKTELGKLAELKKRLAELEKEWEKERVQMSTLSKEEREKEKYYSYPPWTKSPE